MKPKRYASRGSGLDPAEILDWSDRDVQQIAVRTRELETRGMGRTAAAWRAYDEVRRAQAERRS